MHVIILAGQRAGQVNPLAEAHGVSHKCLVPIAGRPLIVHVISAVAKTPDIASVRVVVEREAFAAVGALAPGAILIPSQANLADSVIAGMQGIDGPTVITTADNVNLTPGALDAMRAALGSGADVAIAMARKDDVLAAHPDGQRRFYTFADDAYSNCNLYALAGPHALKAADAFRGGGQFAKSAKRIIDAFGLFNLLLFRSGLVSLDGAMRRVSKRFGLNVRAVVLEDGRHAIDVDNERTYRVAEELLKMRLARAAEAAAPAVPSEFSPSVRASAHA